MIEFINDLEEGWATGKLIDTGKVGHYPTNFVEVSTTNIFLFRFEARFILTQIILTVFTVVKSY